MKFIKILTGIIFLLLISSTSVAYTPQDEGFVQVMVFGLPENPEEVYVGDIVDFTIILKNLTNDTVSNITITQQIQNNIELITLGNLDVGGESMNLTDVSIPDALSDQQLDFSYLNITASNFTGNIQITLQENQQLALNMALNLTIAGENNVDAPNIIYYDHWPDRNEVLDEDSYGASITVRERTTDSRTIYIPSFDTSGANYLQIVGGFLIILVAALMGRLVFYGKRPFEI